MAFAQLEPFGGLVEDMRAGLAPSVAVNMNRTEDTDPISPVAFYPWHQPPPLPPQTPEEISDRLRSLLNAKAKAAAVKDANGN